MFEAKPFPIPVVARLGPGSQDSDEAMDVMPLPRDIAAWRAPVLPQSLSPLDHREALAALHAALAALRAHLAGEAAEPIDLASLGEADRSLIGQVLGEGEVAAQAAGDDGVQAQESVFGGVWRVIEFSGGQVRRDSIEVGAFPRALVGIARTESQPLAALSATLPEGAMNAPALLAELRERSSDASAPDDGRPAQVINLTLLPLSPTDRRLLDEQLGAGRVRALSRGYGKCRVASTRADGVWRVSYFNSQDALILETLEVAAVPDAVRAAREDLEDSAERLAEVLQWLENS